MTTVLYILFALISFFLSFFNDFSENNYLRNPPDRFLHSFHRMKAFWVQMIDLHLFFRYLKGRWHGNQFCEKNGKLPTFVTLAFRNGMGHCYLSVHINSVNDASILCKISCRSINSRVDKAHLWTSGTTRPRNWRILLNIFGYTGPICAVFSPYESAFGADDGFVPYFLICQGTLPWEPNNVGWNLKVMTAD